MPSIPILDLGPEVEELWPQLNEAIQKVLRSQQFIMGPEVTLFEEEVAAWLGSKHAIALNSGTDALVIGLRALGVGAGDEVLTSPFTFFATAEAISSVGATPVFIDIDPQTFNLDPEKLEEYITPETRAIIPVHLYGQACDMARIKDIAEKHGLKILEDVAQAFGATFGHRKLGTLGHAGAFSFFPSKVLGCYGDGGLLATDDDNIAQDARMLRVHGARRKYFNEVVGYNSRLDALQAAILRVKLPYVDQWCRDRQGVASIYDRALAGVANLKAPVAAGWGEHVYHQYTVRIAGGLRDAVKNHLESEGVSTMIYYPVPVHQLPLYQGCGATVPVAEQAAREVLSLPIWPQMGQEIVERVAGSLISGMRAVVS
ncbi:MAG: DegT/DnrJ/EryC1/StrS family aminotransferase [Desulfuromonadales bacterium]|nr:DegT/DnrJ/EryC1/StrS family aminotransferase [Desulfuromonadales bacterium]MDW7756251.1 DegT/DnrJ/EryC1/StrS family aminotransferase [Desulfuromonadales bacterium]